MTGCDEHLGNHGKSPITQHPIYEHLGYKSPFKYPSKSMVVRLSPKVLKNAYFPRCRNGESANVLI